MNGRPTAVAAGKIDVGGDLTVNRLGFGAMRITGPGIWGDPPDRDRAKEALRRAVAHRDHPPLMAAAWRRGVTERPVALAWLLTRSPQVLPIPGSGDPEHVEQTVNGIVRFQANGLPVVSLYCRVDPGASQREVRARVGSLLDQIRPLAKDRDLDHRSRLSVRGLCAGHADGLTGPPGLIPRPVQEKEIFYLPNGAWFTRSGPGICSARCNTGSRGSCRPRSPPGGCAAPASGPRPPSRPGRTGTGGPAAGARRTG